MTLHNLAYQHKLMEGARQAIIEQRFPEYLKQFFALYFGDPNSYP